MVPGGDVALRVEPDLGAVHVHRAVVAAFDVVLAAPQRAHRCGDAGRFRGLGDLAGLHHVVAAGDGAAAKTATRHLGVDFHVLSGHTQHARGGARVQPRHLRAQPQLGLVTAQAHGAVQRLHRRVREVGEHELGADLLGRVGQRANVGIKVDQAFGFGQRLVAGELFRAVHLLHCRRVPGQLQGVAALLGGPVAGGQHRHALAAAVGRHAQHGFHTGDGLGVAVVERLDLSAEHRWPRHHGGELAGQAHVDAVGLVAAGFVARVDTAGGLADEAELLGVFERDFFRHGELHRGLGQRAVAELLAAGADHEAALGAQVSRGHLPLRRCGGHQHGTGAGAEFAVLRVRVLDGVGAAGQVHAKTGVEVGRAGVAVHALHLGPVGVQLFSQDHRQRGLHALSKIEPVDDHGGGAVRRNAHKGTGLLGGLEARRVGGCRYGCVGHRSGRFACQRRTGGEQPEGKAGSPGNLQEAAAGQAALVAKCYGICS